MTFHVWTSHQVSHNGLRSLSENIIIGERSSLGNEIKLYKDSGEYIYIDTVSVIINIFLGFPLSSLAQAGIQLAAAATRFVCLSYVQQNRAAVDGRSSHQGNLNIMGVWKSA